MDDNEKVFEQASDRRHDDANKGKEEKAATSTTIDGTRPMQMPMPMPFASVTSGRHKDSNRKHEKPSQYPERRLHLPRSLNSAGSSHQSQNGKSRGIGRARLPEKLMEHLNADAAPGVLWWLPGNESFALESSRVQSELLDPHFRGTKMSSFIRSLNRWGFRRIFLHALPKTAICFKAKLFKKNAPYLVRQMQLSSYTPQSSAVVSEQSDPEDIPCIASREERPEEVVRGASQGTTGRGTARNDYGFGHVTGGSTGVSQEPSAVLRRLATELQQWTDTTRASEAQLTLTARLQDQLARLSQPTWRQENLLNQNQLGWNQATMPQSSADIQNSLIEAFLSQTSTQPPQQQQQQQSVMGETNISLQLAQSLLSRGRSINAPLHTQYVLTQGGANDYAALLQLLSNLVSSRTQFSRPAQNPPRQTHIQDQLLQLLHQHQSQGPQEPPTDQTGPASQQGRRF